MEPTMAIDIRRRAALLAAALAVVSSITLVAPQQASATTWNYNGTEAARYADKFSCNGYRCGNPAYRSVGDDCTNFVSQTFRDGGVALSADWQPYNYDWVNVSGFELMAYERHASAGYELENKAAAYTDAVVGDHYVYDWGMGAGPSHRSIEVGWGTRASIYAADGTGDYIDQYSNDRYHAPWNYGYLHPDSSINRSTMKIYREHFYSTFS
jgi:hypothetical protein